MNTRKTQIWILRLGLIGLSLALLAMKQTIEVRMAPYNSAFLCSFINWADCGAVHRSQFALVAGVPVAWFGFLFYGWLSTITGWFMVQQGVWSPVIVKVVYQVSLMALLFNSYLLFAMAIKLQNWCLICLVMFMVNLAVFWLAASVHRNCFASLSFYGFSASLTVHYVSIVLLFMAGVWMIRSVVPFAQKKAATVEAPVAAPLSKR